MAQTDDSYFGCNGIEKSNQSCCQIVGMQYTPITITLKRNRPKYVSYFGLFFICWICSSILLIFCLCLDVSCFLSEKDSKQKSV